MSTDGQLKALLTSCELAEQVALQEKLRIEKVVEDREQLLRASQAEKSSLVKEIQRNERHARTTSLRAGQASQAVSRVEWAKRARSQLELISKQICEREKDLQSAVERARIAEAALVESRLEKRKIEKLIERRKLGNETLEIAREEQSSDESFGSFKPRGRLLL